MGGSSVLKWSTIGTGFDGAETNCRIAHVSGAYAAFSAGGCTLMSLSGPH